MSVINVRRFGNDTGPRQCISNRLGNYVLNGLGPTKTDLGLRRMNIYIDLFERNFQKKKSHRIHAMRQYRAISFEQAAGDSLVSDKSPVNKKVLSIASCASLSRRGNETADPGDKFSSATYRDQTFKKLSTKDLIGAFLQVTGRRKAKQLAPITRQRKSDLRMGERIVSNDAGEMIILCRLGTHEFSASRHVVEQVADSDRSPDVSRRVLYIHEPPALDLDQRGRVGIGGPRF